MGNIWNGQWARTAKRTATILCTLACVLSIAMTVGAHSGRTDGRGGHKDNKNKSGLGSYHYHCGGYPAHLHTSGHCPYREVFPKSVSIKADKTTLGIGEKINVVANVRPSDSCDTDVTWTSSDRTVASVSGGIVTAKGYGTATITAETFNGKTGSIKITVKEITADKVVISGVPDGSDIYIGHTFDLTAKITPDNVDDPTLVWSSSNNEVATVSENGSVVALSEGKTEIRATASNGTYGKVVIKVKEKHVQTVDIAEEEMTIFLGDEFTLKATITPGDATDQQLLWTTQDPAVVSVSETGHLAALDRGETTVCVTSANGKSDTIKIVVKEILAESVRIEAPDTVKIGDQVAIDAVIDPADASVRDIEWRVDDPSVATISSTGILTAHTVGKVTITAIQKDVSATHFIEVLRYG